MDVLWAITLCVALVVVIFLGRYGEQHDQPQ